MTDCPNGEQRDLALLYLAGRLPEDEAKLFEAHYFACERCAQDVEEGSELRAALGRPAVASAAREVRSTRTWLPFAAAAVIAFVGVGVWQLTRRTAEEPARPVLRGPNAEVLLVKIESAPDRGIELSWQPHPDAAAYEIEVFASSGVRVWGAEVNEPRLRIGAGVLPAPVPGQPLEVEVRALDSMRQVVASSDPTPLPAPR